MFASCSTGRGWRESLRVVRSRTLNSRQPSPGKTCSIVMRRASYPDARRITIEQVFPGDGCREFNVRLRTTRRLSRHPRPVEQLANISPVLIHATVVMALETDCAVATLGHN